MGPSTVSAFPLSAVTQFLNSGLPVAAVAHSFHVRALMDPSLRSIPAFQQFSLVELNELHHQIAALGALIRLQQGDSSALTDLGTNLAGFLQNRLIGLQVTQALPAQVLQSPSIQAMMALTNLSNQQVLQNLPVLSQALVTSGAPAPGPLAVGAP